MLEFRSLKKKPCKADNYGFNSPTVPLAHEITQDYSEFNDDGFQNRLNDITTQGKISFQDNQAIEDLSFRDREEEYDTTITNQVFSVLGADTRTNYMANRTCTINVISKR